MNFSEKIDILESYVNSLGFQLIKFSDELPHTGGRVYYDKKEIHIKCGSAEDAFYTVLHEAGHCLSYNKYFIKLKQLQPNVEKRELYAYFYGWVINKQLSLGVDKETWRKEHE